MFYHYLLLRVVESKAGSGAQEKLLKEYENQDKKFKNESNALKKQETELINQKKNTFSRRL